jgi:heat shock protein HslJ
MFRQKTVLLAVVAAMFVLIACVPITREGAAAPTADPLAGTGWVLSELNGQPVVADTTVTLQFGADGQASGTDGCNRYNSSYSTEGDAIQFSPNAAMTMMACPEPIMDQAAAYMAALTTAATFAVDGDTLTLSDASGATLAVFAAQNSDLAGSAWSVTAYNNGNQAVVGLIEGTELTAVFGADGTVSGTSGCNNFSGGYMADGAGAIQIGPLVSTMMACSDPEGVMEQEMQYLAALQTAATYRMEGDTMEMRTAEDALAAMFVRVPQE